MRIFIYLRKKKLLGLLITLIREINTFKKGVG